MSTRYLMNKKRVVPIKNYIILVVVSIVTILLTLYVNSWIKTYKEDKLSISPLSSVVEEVNIKEIDLTLSEMNEVLLYVGYTNDKKIYNMEKNLLSYIKNHDLIDKVIYLDVTNYLSDNEYLKILKDTFDEVKDDLKEAPMLIYVKNGNAEDVVSSKNGVLYTYDIANLNDKYNLEN